MKPKRRRDSLTSRINQIINQRPGVTQGEIRSITDGHQVSVSRVITELRSQGRIRYEIADDGSTRHYYPIVQQDVIKQARKIGGHFGILIAQL